MADMIEVVVVWAPAAGMAQTARLSVALGTTIFQAAVLSKLVTSPGLQNAHQAKYGVWGKLMSSDALVRAGDRIEIYRPLQADPKLARTRRANKQKGRNRKDGVAKY